MVISRLRLPAQGRMSWTRPVVARSLRGCGSLLRRRERITVAGSTGLGPMAGQMAAAAKGSVRRKGTWICLEAVVSGRNAGTWHRGVGLIARRAPQRCVTGATLPCSATVSAPLAFAARRATTRSA